MKNQLTKLLLSAVLLLGAASQANALFLYSNAVNNTVYSGQPITIHADNPYNGIFNVVTYLTGKDSSKTGGEYCQFTEHPNSSFTAIAISNVYSWWDNSLIASDTATLQITVTQPVTNGNLSISATASAVCPGTSVTVSASVTGYPSNYYADIFISGYNNNNYCTGFSCSVSETLNDGTNFFVNATIYDEYYNQVDMLYSFLYVDVVSSSQNSVSITTPDADKKVLPNEPIAFSADQGNGTNVSYSWHLDNGSFLSTVNNYTANVLSPGTHLITVNRTATGTGQCPVTNTVSKTDTFEVYPAPNFTITSADSGNAVCPNQPVTYTITTDLPAGYTTSYVYAFTDAPNTHYGITGNMFTIAKPSDYGVMLVPATIYAPGNINVGILPMNTNTVTTTISQSFTPFLSISSYDADNLIMSCQTASFVIDYSNSGNLGASPTFQWNRNGVPVPGATDPDGYDVFQMADSDVVSLTAGNLGTCASNPQVTSADILTNVEPAPALYDPNVVIDNVTSQSFRFSMTHVSGKGMLVLLFPLFGSGFGGSANCDDAYNAPAINRVSANGYVDFTDPTLPLSGNNGRMIYKNLSTALPFNFKFTVGGLQSNGLYGYEIYAYDSSAAGVNYISLGGGNVRMLITAPSVTASNLIVTVLDSASTNLSWTNGDGNGRIVIVRNGVIRNKPVDNVYYNPSAVFGAGDDVAGDSSYVVYRGSGNNVTVTGLTYKSQYRVALIEYNDDLNYSNYNNNRYLKGTFRQKLAFRGVATLEEATADISIFPNPSEGLFNISADLPVNAMVKDLQGRTLLNVTNASSVDLSNYATGVYLLTITDADGALLKTERLVKK